MSGRCFTYDECGKTIVRGTMDAGINNVIYMELYSGPKMANGRCGKTIDTGTIDRGSTVLGLGLWYFLSAGSLISALCKSDISLSLWYIHCQLLLVKKKYY